MRRVLSRRRRPPTVVGEKTGRVKTEYDGKAPRRTRADRTEVTADGRCIVAACMLLLELRIAGLLRLVVLHADRVLNTQPCVPGCSVTE